MLLRAKLAVHMGEETTTKQSKSALKIDQTSADGTTISEKPPEKPPRQFHYRSVEQLSATMSLLPSTTAPVMSSTPSSSSASSPSARPLRVAQPPPLATAFPSCFSASKPAFPSSISVPSMPKPASITVPFLRAAASSSSGFGTVHHQTPIVVGDPNVRCEKGRNRFGQMGYEELLELARNQQHQIESNDNELDERRKAVALFEVAKRTAASETEQQQKAKMLMANLRTHIARDELELNQLGNRQREAKQLREHNGRQSRELGQLEAEYAHDDEQLRRAVAKVDSLRHQLELLYQRRATAADAAVCRQRRINGEGGGVGQQLQREKRPKASVVPFKLEKRDGMEKECDGEEGEMLDCGRHRIVAAENGGSGGIQRRTPAPFIHSLYQPPIINWRKNAPPQVDQYSIKRNSMTALKRLSWAAESGGDEHIMATFLVNEQKKGRTHISFGETIPLKTTTIEKELGEQRQGMVNGLERDQLDEPFFGQNTDEEKDKEDIEITSDEKVRKKIAEERDEQKEVKRKESKEAKTDSAEGNGTEKKRMLSSEESKKEKSNGKESSPLKRMAEQLNSWEFHKKFAETVEEKEEERMKMERKGEIDERMEQEEVIREETEQAKLSSDRSEESDDQLQKISEPDDEVNVSNNGNERQEVTDEQKMADKIQLNEGKKEEEEIKEEENWREMCGGLREVNESPNEGETTTDNDEGPISAEEETPPEFDEACLVRSPNLRSILQLKRTSNELSKKRVMFDLIVLFLDVAHEGEYDTLVELASKIDISAANSEGITALHYAICAGNHEIMKFLIENGADVNALDVDGWSPLHCAASCNNPIMLRQLIENGACPFATTFSKSERPIDLFDESHDFAASAEYMDMVEECMGLINNGKVYVAFSYEAEHEDELTFSDGDELRVLRRSESGDNELDEDENGLWWLCEHCVTERQGFAPRNYLSLYPTWRSQSRYPISFELPHQLKKHHHDQPGLAESKDAKSSMQPEMNTDRNNELSTYA